MIGPMFSVNGKKFVQISSRREIRETGPCQPFWLISIRDPKLDQVVPFQLPVASLYLSFYDLDKPIGDGYKLIGTTEAIAIAKFVDCWLWSDEELLVVQCEAGISRSAAVAAAILKRYTDDDSGVFSGNLYLPNRLVYSTVLNALTLEYGR